MLPTISSPARFITTAAVTHSTSEQHIQLADARPLFTSDQKQRDAASRSLRKLIKTVVMKFSFVCHNCCEATPSANASIPGAAQGSGWNLNLAEAARLHSRAVSKAKLQLRPNDARIEGRRNNDKCLH